MGSRTVHVWSENLGLGLWSKGWVCVWKRDWLITSEITLDSVSEMKFHSLKQKFVSCLKINSVLCFEFSLVLCQIKRWFSGSDKIRLFKIHPCSVHQIKFDWVQSEMLISSFSWIKSGFSVFDKIVHLFKFKMSLDWRLFLPKTMLRSIYIMIWIGIS